MDSAVVHIPAIRCGHCVAAITRELMGVAGVLGVTGDPDTRRVTVTWEPPADWSAVVAVLAEIGYPAEEA